MTFPHNLSWPYRLRAEHSENPAEGACAMDAINWLVHGEHGHDPVCVCPIIKFFVIPGNDAMPDDVRQQLIPYLHRMAGSFSFEHEAARSKALWSVGCPEKADSYGVFHAWEAKCLAEQLAETGQWDVYFEALDAALNAGPQGKPWSADILNVGVAKFRAASGLEPVG